MSDEGVDGVGGIVDVDMDVDVVGTVFASDEDGGCVMLAGV